MSDREQLTVRKIVRTHSLPMWGGNSRDVSYDNGSHSSGALYVMLLLLLQAVDFSHYGNRENWGGRFAIFSRLPWNGIEQCVFSTHVGRRRLSLYLILNGRHRHAGGWGLRRWMAGIFRLEFARKPICHLSPCIVRVVRGVCVRFCALRDLDFPRNCRRAGANHLVWTEVDVQEFPGMKYNLISRFDGNPLQDFLLLLAIRSHWDRTCFAAKCSHEYFFSY